jgi:hypothetical protein
MHADHVDLRLYNNHQCKEFPSLNLFDCNDVIDRPVVFCLCMRDAIPEVLNSAEFQNYSHVI